MPRRWDWILLVLSGALACACTSGNTEGRKARLGQEERYRGRSERGGPDLDELKRGTGISQVGRVVAGGPASPSPLSPGVELDRLWSEFDDWEPVVAADRFSPHVYQMTTRLDGNRAWVVFRVSEDGGETWGTDRLLWRTTRQQYDPQLAVADDGTVFACWLEVPRWESLVSRSSDYGQTWTPPVVVENTLAWTDHPCLAVSGDGQHVYVAFNKEDSYVVSSHDGGATFGPPVRTHQSGRTWYHTGGAVAPDGSVYFGGAEYHPNYNGPTRVNVLRSHDGGATFQKTFFDRSLSPPLCNQVPGCYWGFIGPGTGLAVDTEGTVLFAYNAGFVFMEPQQIYVRVTRNGTQWGDAVQISEPSRSTNNAFPVVVSGPQPGDFSVVWQADRDGDMRSWNTWMRRTLDGGETWGPLTRLSTRADGAPYTDVKGYGFPYGDYMGASCDGDGNVHAIWGAGLSYDGPGGTWFTRTK